MHAINSFTRYSTLKDFSFQVTGQWIESGIFLISDKKEEVTVEAGKSWEEEQREKERERKRREQEAWEREQRELEMLQGKSSPLVCLYRKT